MKTRTLFFIAFSLLAYTAFSQNTNFGVNAGNAGNFNTSIGFSAGDIVTGSHGTYAGHQAGKNVTIGLHNSFFGSNAGLNTTTSSGNSCFGYASGINNLGHNNSFFGKESGLSNTSGVMNSFFGAQAGYRNISGQQNAFFGCEAGYNCTTAMFNSFFGTKAGHGNEDGMQNTMIGNQAGLLNKSGDGNTFIGNLAGKNELAGYNTFVGHSCGTNAVDGQYNVYLGAFSGLNNTVGAQNTFIGYFAGADNDGSRNVFIGNYAGQTETGSNKLIIDNGMFAPGTAPLIYGSFSDRRVGIATTALGSFTLSVNGDAFATGMWVSSDKRFKQKEKVIAGALEKVKAVHGFSYEFKQEDAVKEKNFSKGSQLGFLAQDLQKVFPELVKDDGAGYLAVNYQGMIPVLLEAIKELSGQVQHQSIELNLLRETVGNQPALSHENVLGRLHQNVPNPSVTDTRISYELAETAHSGILYIFDLQGKTIGSYKLSQRQGEVKIPAGQLEPGLYHYSLVVDGNIVDTKKMIMTK